MVRKPSNRIPLNGVFSGRPAHAPQLPSFWKNGFLSCFTVPAVQVSVVYDTCKLSTHTIGKLPHEALNLPVSFIFLVEEDLIELEIQVFNKNGHILLDSFLAEVINSSSPHKSRETRHSTSLSKKLRESEITFKIKSIMFRTTYQKGARKAKRVRTGLDDFRLEWPG